MIRYGLTTAILLAGICLSLELPIAFASCNASSNGSYSADCDCDSGGDSCHPDTDGAELGAELGIDTYWTNQDGCRVTLTQNTHWLCTGVAAELRQDGAIPVKCIIGLSAPVSCQGADWSIYSPNLYSMNGSQWICPATGMLIELKLTSGVSCGTCGSGAILLAQYVTCTNQ